MTVIVSERGQMVIPSAIRKRYNIKAKSRVELIDTGREIVIVPVPKQAVRQSKGVLKGVSAKDVVAARREERKK
ncbi:MAG: AbrB/MazE/SpoVT family DNA-binding domain-containing protein [Candidatus Omnitrophica bacterium]|nr:AbrB/MazE/SpoVT family DNA-binding domain-containing protein [Candidatus Omnitrophota bacterium]